MNFFEGVIDFLARGALLQTVFLGALWGGDKILSEDGRKHIYASLVGVTSAPSYPLAVVDAFFGPRVGLGRLIWHSVAFSIAAFCVLLVCYVTTVRGFWETLYSDNSIRISFLKQIIFHGIPLVCVVNFFAFLVYGSLTQKIATQARGARKILVADLVVRFGLFWLVEAIIYILFTWQFGSFGGSFATALGSIGKTIRPAALFENLTGVFLYAALIAGFPLFVSAYIEQSKQSPWLAAFTRVIFFYLPFKNYPVRATGVVLAIFVTLLATITSLLTAVL